MKMKKCVDLERIVLMRMDLLTYDNPMKIFLKIQFKKLQVNSLIKMRSFLL
jgi:hypothetical protein